MSALGATRYIAVMARERVVVTVAGVLAGVLIATVVTADPAPIADRAPDLGWVTPDVDTPVDEPGLTEPNEPAPVAPAEAIDVAEATETMTFVLQMLAFAAIAAAALYMARSVWARRAEQHGGGRVGGGGITTLAEVADAIVADADAHRAALDTGSPRNAIVACWLRLESSVESAGVAHDPALTSTELTGEVLQRFPVDTDAATRLGALYREARFSTHDLDERHRQAAIAALDEVHAGLRRVGRRAPEAPPPATVTG